MHRALVPALLAAALALPAGAAGRSSAERARLLTPTLADLAAAGPVAVRDAVVEGPMRPLRSGTWGGVYTTPDGSQVRVFSSDAYPVDQAANQQLADFFGALVHGQELSQLTVFRAPIGEVQGVCGRNADGCYSPIRESMYVPGEPTPDGTSTAVIMTHEYGHHVAANRDNPPWFAGDWGTKRWASYTNVCAREAAGTAFPGDEGENYANNPGEAFAESYRVMNEVKAGATAFQWPIVDRSWFPDSGALAALEADVHTPWTAPTRVVFRGTLPARPGAARAFRLATPLDGTLRLRLKGPIGASFRLSLFDRTGRKLIRRGSSIATTVCGAREQLLKVTRIRGAGKFEVDASRP